MPRYTVVAPKVGVTKVRSGPQNTNQVGGCSLIQLAPPRSLSACVRGVGQMDSTRRRAAAHRVGWPCQALNGDFNLFKDDDGNSILRMPEAPCDDRPPLPYSYPHRPHCCSFVAKEVLHLPGMCCF